MEFYRNNKKVVQISSIVLLILLCNIFCLAGIVVDKTIIPTPTVTIDTPKATSTAEALPYQENYNTIRRASGIVVEQAMNGSNSDSELGGVALLSIIVAYKEMLLMDVPTNIIDDVTPCYSTANNILNDEGEMSSQNALDYLAILKVCAELPNI